MAITGTQQPQSPSIQKQSNGNKVYTRVFKYARDFAWEAEMPAVGSLDATYGYFRSYSSSNAEAYVTVTLVYDSEGSGSNFTPSDGDTEYWAQSVGEEKPVEYHADYRTRWNYGFYTKNDGNARTIADFPAGATGEPAWKASTDPNDLAAFPKFSWFKEHPGAEWIKIKGPTKGNDFFVEPTRVVFKRAYHRTQASAEAALDDVGKLVNPGETFGATTNTAPFNLADTATYPFKTNPGNWLVKSTNTVYDGKYWVAETEYWHAVNGWDGDIYEAP